MGAHRYGISLLAFNSISHEWDNEFNKRREVLYLKATVYYLFEVNSISLYWQEKMTLLTNSVREKKKTVGKCSGNKTQHEKVCWIITKTNNGRNFLFTKFSTFSLLTEEKSNQEDGQLAVILKITAFVKYSRCQFPVLSREKCHNQNQVILGFSLCICKQYEFFIFAG